MTEHISPAPSPSVKTYRGATIADNLSLEEKLQILTDAAKYDVACTSSGVARKGNGQGMGNTMASVIRLLLMVGAFHYLRFYLRTNVSTIVNIASIVPLMM